MGGFCRVQMVFNLDPSFSTIHARFDLPPFTSFEPLALFTLLPHYGFWSFEDPASLTTTGGQSFISTLRFRTFFTFFFRSRQEKPRTYADPCTDPLVIGSTYGATRV